MGSDLCQSDLSMIPKTELFRDGPRDGQLVANESLAQWNARRRTHLLPSGSFIFLYTEKKA